MTMEKTMDEIVLASKVNTLVENMGDTVNGEVVLALLRQERWVPMTEADEKVAILKEEIALKEQTITHMYTTSRVREEKINKLRDEVIQKDSQLESALAAKKMVEAQSQSSKERADTLQTRVRDLVTKVDKLYDEIAESAQKIKEFQAAIDNSTKQYKKLLATPRQPTSKVLAQGIPPEVSAEVKRVNDQNAADFHNNVILPLESSTALSAWAKLWSRS